MDRSIQFSLISKTREKNEFGLYEETVTLKSVYGQISSVSASEFFAAGQNGFKPEYRLTMFEPDYSGEDEVVIGNVIYSVYRTYHARNDMIELYVERRAGNQMEEDDEGNS